MISQIRMLVERNKLNDISGRFRFLEDLIGESGVRFPDDHSILSHAESGSNDQREDAPHVNM